MNFAIFSFRRNFRVNRSEKRSSARNFDTDNVMLYMINALADGTLGAATDIVQNASELGIQMRQSETNEFLFGGAADTGSVELVVCFQGPAANGTLEVQELMPALSVLQDRGHHVALVTAGRMSWAAGMVLAAIHVTPEALHRASLAELRDDDVIRLNAPACRVDVLVGDAEWVARDLAMGDLEEYQMGIGRELFAPFRSVVSGADVGARMFAVA